MTQKALLPKNMDDSDLALSVLAAQGDSEAFLELVSRYMEIIRAKAASFHAPSLEMDDLCQEGLLGLLNAAKTYDSGKGEASFRTYATVCISNRMIMAYRKASSQKNQPMNYFVSLNSQENTVQWHISNAAVDPEEALLLGEEFDCLRRRMRQLLSKLEQQVFFLYLNGCTYSEISKKLSITEKAADNALQRARRKLR